VVVVVVVVCKITRLFCRSRDEGSKGNPEDNFGSSAQEERTEHLDGAEAVRTVAAGEFNPLQSGSVESLAAWLKEPR
jgi:hypothetical protein